MSLFNPSRDQVREFFFGLWAKSRAGEALTPLESMALAIVMEHPEYHGVLADPERHREREWRPEGGETNPFLHLSMHLAIEEQLSIDQPPGIREAVRRLEIRARLGARRAARGHGLPGRGGVAGAAQRRAVRQRHLPRLPRPQGREVIQGGKVIRLRNLI